MEQEKNNPAVPVKGRKFIGIAIVIIVLVVIAAVAGKGSWKKSGTTESGLSNQAELPEGCKPGYLFSETTGKPCPVAGEEEKTTTPAPAASAPSGFEAAIQMYAGKVISVDAACTATPSTATFAVGTRVLIANNSKETLTLKAGDRTQELTAYHYFTTSFKAPGTYALSCNGAEKAAITIN